MSIVWTTIQSVHHDILDGVAPITVPGLPRDTTPIRGPCTQTMWQCLLTLSNQLLAASTAIEQWANRWEMQFGVAKCGIISFTGHLAPRLDNPLDIRLHGQLVSRVESYKYLGVLIDSKLDHSAWLKQKRSALEHTISAFTQCWPNHQFNGELSISHILCSGHGQSPSMGRELVGGNKSHLAPLHNDNQQGIRLFTGARLSTAIGPLRLKLELASLLTRSLVSRARLLERSVTKRTPINAICSVQTMMVYTECPRAVGKSPSAGSGLVGPNSYTEQILADTTSQTKDSQATTLVCIDGDSANMWDSASLQKYVTRQLLDTSGILQGSQFLINREHMAQDS
ncbi:hypothetical protein BASA62_010129 [Batrachochytrium salamandrivorans]|nr:hypothetical protein BASA62_010129 [Batrachochytrium salamandrivorans]